MWVSGLNKLKKISLITVLITLFLAYTNFSFADTLTPPKVHSINQEYDSAKKFRTGDVLAFSTTFSSDSFGLKNLSVDFSSPTDCIRWNIKLGPGGPYGYKSKGVSDDPGLKFFGRLVDNKFIFYAELKSSCYTGINSFTIRTSISDFSNLSDSFSQEFKIEVINGLAKRPGESRGPDQALEIVDYSKLLIGKRPQGSTLEIVLPSFSKEGVSLIWGTRGGNMCSIREKSSPEDFSQILLIRDSNNYCDLWFYSQVTPLDLYSEVSGGIDFALLRGEVVTLSRYKQSITENQNKQTTIICLKGKSTKKVTALKPKCPSGYKVKK